MLILRVESFYVIFLLCETELRLSGQVGKQCRWGFCNSRCHSEDVGIPLSLVGGTVFDSLSYRTCENQLLSFGACSLTSREYFVRTDDPGLDSLLMRREYKSSNLSHLSRAVSKHSKDGLKLHHELLQARGDLSTLSAISTESMHHHQLQLASGAAWLVVISVVVLTIVGLIVCNVRRAKQGVGSLS